MAKSYGSHQLQPQLQPLLNHDYYYYHYTQPVNVCVLQVVIVGWLFRARAAPTHTPTPVVTPPPTPLLTHILFLTRMCALYVHATHAHTFSLPVAFWQALHSIVEPRSLMPQYKCICIAVLIYTSDVCVHIYLYMLMLFCLLMYHIFTHTSIIYIYVHILHLADLSVSPLCVCLPLYR